MEKDSVHYAPEFYQDECTLVNHKLECTFLLLKENDHTIYCNLIGKPQEYLSTIKGDLNIGGLVDKMEVFGAINFIKERHDLEDNFILKLEASVFDEILLIAEDSYKKINILLRV